MKWYNWVMLINPLVSTIVIVAGWYFVNRYNVSRDIENKKREIKIEYLINAYRNIEKSSGYPTMDISKSTEKDIKRAEDLERALADIQLLGTIYQIKEVRKSCEKATLTPDKSDPNLIKFEWRADELLLDIRRELRRELLLEEIDPKESIQEGISKIRWSKMMEISFLSRDKNQTP
jgi:hypothetical protein